MFEYAEQAADRGLMAIIAGAGGAAHLPGMVAAKTVVPVLGVPVQSRALNGMDSLLSIVQMPAGIPVGTLAIGAAGAVNAALEGGDAGPNLNHLLEHIQPALAATGEGGVDAVSRSNAALQAERMVQESDIIRRAVEEEGVKIVSAYYHLRTGAFEFE